MLSATTEAMPAWRATLNRVGVYVLALLLVALLAAGGFRLFGMRAYPGLTNVAHAGGAVNGFTYINGLAAFDAAYERGFRRFEVDLRITKDGVIVCGHDWDHFEGIAPTFTEFLQLRFQLMYGGCTFEELVGWFQDHPDTTLVSDAKDGVRYVNDQLRQALGLQLVPQVFTIADAKRFGGQGTFPIILALYKLDSIGERYALVTALNDKLVSVAGVAMQDTDALAGLGLWAKFWLGAPVYAYTVNSCTYETGLNWLGVDAVYTDTLGANGCGQHG